MTSCLNNLKQIGTGLYTYLNDWDDSYPMNRFPTSVALHSNTDGDLQPSWYNWKRALESYMKTNSVYLCPSNPEAWTQGYCGGCIGDETNCQNPWKGNQNEQLPNSYAYNGAFFHENAPFDSGMEAPRQMGDNKDPSNLIFLLESMVSCPDLGDWAYQEVFHHGNNISNWLFADTYAKAMKESLTFSPTYMWGNPTTNQASANGIASALTKLKL